MCSWTHVLGHVNLWDNIIAFALYNGYFFIYPSQVSFMAESFTFFYPELFHIDCNSFVQRIVMIE